ncbi:uncharacterized protein LOC103317701 isoform X2 [Nasonia vitripennis]|uniref:Uncharacterized protein n=2 Tax=Nasonia vitripennis TaxID=7425 RepID=A0A7M7M2S0_NASVI|nr:uncharacterized protein LOC103317701 isoform X2 [Nasonia vitripennis]
MQCSEQEDDASSDEEIHEAVDSILAEDERDKSARKRQLAEREAANRSKRRNPSAEFKRRQTGAEKSRRFSLRVMEAMRALERRTERRAECPVSNKSPATCEIVDYVDRKFRNDGDVEAQVRIALKRLACQGFVKCEGGDAYTLLAPFASQLGRAGKANLGLHSTAELTDCRRHRSGRDARSNRSTARCRGGCRRDQSCKQTERLERRPQESSEIDLSIPSSVEEDIFRRRIERDIESLQHRCPPGETEAENATMELRKPAQAAGEPGRRNSELRIEACGDEDRRQGKCQLNRSVAGSPRKGISPAREEDRIVGAIRNPAREIEAAMALPEFADDAKDDYEPVDVPDEDEQLEEDDEDEGDDAGEDDELLRELRQHSDARIPMDEDRDRELRRWIRNCRRECERRAREGGDSADGE